MQSIVAALFICTPLSDKTVGCRMAQNEGIFEKCISLGGLVFLLGQYAMKKCFYKIHLFLGVPTV